MSEQLIYPPPYQVIPKHLDFKITKEGELLNKYISFDGFNLDNIQTFDHFINTKLPEKLLQDQILFGKDNINSTTKIYYKFINLQQHIPTLTPLECKNTGNTYSMKISANIQVTKEFLIDGEKKYEVYINPDRYYIISFPVPVGSQYSNTFNKSKNELIEMGLDQCEPKGYFIVDGIEYFTTLKEELQVNKFIIYDERISKYHLPVCIINCLTYTEKNKIVMKWNQKTSKTKSEESLSQHLSIFFYINMGKRNEKLLSYPMDKKADTEYNIFTLIAILYFVDAINRGDQNMIYNFDYDIMIENFINNVLVHAKSNEKSAIKSKLLQTKKALNLKNLNRPQGIDYWKFVFYPILVNKDMLNYQELYESLFKLYEYFFPQTKDFMKKYNSFSYMTYIYCRVLIGKAKITDRDSWNVKQLTSMGTIYERQFNMSWKAIIGKLNKEIILQTLDYNPQKISTHVIKYFNSGDIEKNFTKCFLNNNWNTFKQKQQGLVLSSMFERSSQLWSYSQLGKIEGNVETKSKNMSIRTFKPSQAGFVCFIETPDGQKCGIIKHKAMTAQLTIMYLNNYVDEIFKTLTELTDVESISIVDFRDEYNNTILCVNGVIYGWTNGRLLADYMRQIRRNSYSEFNKSLAIVLEEDNNILYINTSGDNLVRPLLIVDQSDHKLVIDKLNMWENNFEDLIRNGCVEYIDPFEQEHIYISENVRNVRENKNNSYTHCEMDPTAIFGISAAMIPYANMNQGPRNLFQCKFGTQAISVPMTNYQLRTDVNLKVLAYPSQPLVQTQAHKLYNLQELPIGQTSILAIGVFEGFNQEDALIVKRSFVERGAFRYTKYVEFKFNKRKIQNTMGANPLNVKNLIRKSQQRYKNIDQNGIPIMHSIIRENDCVIGRVKRNIIGKEEKWEDVSVYAGLSQDGVVDRIIVSDNLIIVRLRQVRMPIEGDKFAPRHAQKTTIGRIVNDEDMPFSPYTKLVPDMILNPHAIPSRMTIGLLIEMLTSKIGALKGEIYNATSFNDFKVEELYKELKNYGYDSKGYEYMIDGRTGNRIKLPVYVGPCYYLILKHNIRDKIQQRAARGKVSAQTRQPIKGRANRGGPREGEMERDSYISHGALGAVYSSLCLSSDYYQMIICSNCGSFPKYKDKDGGIYECPTCEKSEMLVKCSISYVFKTFMQMLNGIGIRIIPKFLCPEDEPKYREIKKDIIEDEEDLEKEESEEEEEESVDEGMEDLENVDEDLINEVEEDLGEAEDLGETEGVEIENEYD